jgi:hypothetical protein
MMRPGGSIVRTGKFVRIFRSFDPVPGMRQLGRLKISDIGLHQNSCARHVPGQFFPPACADYGDSCDGAAEL